MLEALGGFGVLGLFAVGAAALPIKRSRSLLIFKLFAIPAQVLGHLQLVPLLAFELLLFSMF